MAFAPDSEILALSALVNLNPTQTALNGESSDGSSEQFTPKTSPSASVDGAISESGTKTSPPVEVKLILSTVKGPKSGSEEIDSPTTPTNPVSSASKDPTIDPKIVQPASHFQGSSSKPVFGKTTAMSSPLANQTSSGNPSMYSGQLFGGRFSHLGLDTTASPFASLNSSDKPSNGFGTPSNAGKPDAGTLQAKALPSLFNQSAPSVLPGFQEEQSSTPAALGTSTFNHSTALNVANLSDKTTHASTSGSPSTKDTPHLPKSDGTGLFYPPGPLQGRDLTTLTNPESGSHKRGDRSDQKGGSLNPFATFADQPALLKPPRELSGAHSLGQSDPFFSSSTPHVTQSSAPLAKLEDVSTGQFQWKHADNQGTEWQQSPLPPLLPDFVPLVENDYTWKIHFQTITSMLAYNKVSLEELRLTDYNRGRGPSLTSTKAFDIVSRSFGESTRLPSQSWPTDATRPAESFGPWGSSTLLPDLDLFAKRIDNYESGELFKTVFGSSRETIFAQKIRAATVEKSKAEASARGLNFGGRLHCVSAEMGAEIAQKRLDCYTQSLGAWLVSKHDWREHYEDLKVELQKRRPVDSSEVYKMRKSLNEWEEHHLKDLAEELGKKKRWLESEIAGIQRRVESRAGISDPSAKHWKVLAALESL